MKQVVIAGVSGAIGGALASAELEIGAMAMPAARTDSPWSACGGSRAVPATRQHLPSPAHRLVELRQAYATSAIVTYTVGRTEAKAELVTRVDANRLVAKIKAPHKGV